MRTRTPPTSRVRQYAAPVSPLCSVRSMEVQSVVSKGMPLIFIGSPRRPDLSPVLRQLYHAVAATARRGSLTLRSAEAENRRGSGHSPRNISGGGDDEDDGASRRDGGRTSRSVRPRVRVW